MAERQMARKRKQMEIRTHGIRSDIDRFFELTDVLGRRGDLLDRRPAQRKHEPFLVIRQDGDVLHIDICKSVVDLVSTYEDDALVLVQWPGEWRSDFLKMTVGQIKAARDDRGYYNPLKRTQEPPTGD